jgi:hypothetical protein
VNTSALGSYTITYDVSDSAGNAAAQVTRTVNVVDTTKPVITLAGANPQIIPLGGAYTEPGATATDNVDGDISGNIVIDASGVNTAVAGSYTVTYNVVDSSGNAATQVTRTVNVVPGNIGTPVAMDDAFTIDKNTVLNGNVLADNGSGADTLGDPPNTVHLVSNVTSGTLDLNPVDGTFTYTPDTDFNGSDSFTYNITDSDPETSNTATVSITVTVTATPSLQTVSFQDGVDGYTGTRDTKLMSQDPTTNFGTATKLELDGSPDRSALLYWDLSSIPPGSIVDSVDITVNITNGTTHNYEFYESRQPWVESEATWNQYASGQSWQVAGADGSSDRGSTVFGVISGGKGLATISLNAAGVAMVQAWVDNPPSNLGFIILNYISATNGLDFSSRETGTVSVRPKLTVTYSTVN